MDYMMRFPEERSQKDGRITYHILIKGTNEHRRNYANPRPLIRATSRGYTCNRENIDVLGRNTSLLATCRPSLFFY